MPPSGQTGGASVLYSYEKLGWAIIFVANTTASAYLYATVDTLGGSEILIQLNLLFGFVCWRRAWANQIVGGFSTR